MLLLDLIQGLACCGGDVDVDVAGEHGPRGCFCCFDTRSWSNFLVTEMPLVP